MWVKLCEGSHVKADERDGSLRDDLQPGTDVSKSYSKSREEGNVPHEKTDLVTINDTALYVHSVNHLIFTENI